jgi:hypothetical protein
MSQKNTGSKPVKRSGVDPAENGQVYTVNGRRQQRSAAGPPTWIAANNCLAFLGENPLKKADRGTNRGGITHPWQASTLSSFGRSFRPVFGLLSGTLKDSSEDRLEGAFYNGNL